jgi:hypothetical protein
MDCNSGGVTKICRHIPVSIAAGQYWVFYVKAYDSLCLRTRKVLGSTFTGYHDYHCCLWDPRIENPIQQRNHVGVILRADVTTQPDTKQTQRFPTLDIPDVINTIYIG